MTVIVSLPAVFIVTNCDRESGVIVASHTVTSVSSAQGQIEWLSHNRMQTLNQVQHSHMATVTDSL